MMCSCYCHKQKDIFYIFEINMFIIKRKNMKGNKVIPFGFYKENSLKINPLRHYFKQNFRKYIAVNKNIF